MSDYPIPEHAEIEGERWPQPMRATEEIVLATMFTAMSLEFYEFRLKRPDSWTISANRMEDGWLIDRGQIGSGEGFRAVPIGDPRSGLTLKRHHYWTRKAVHVFTIDQAKDLVIAFLLGDIELSCVAWMKRTFKK